MARSKSTVLLTGETGTGKELFAQSIHNASSRSGKPFIALNCSALPASLIESVLFGYEGGAFTGANKKGQPGVFEQAGGGTLFLDEVSEMDYDLQARLLRSLQEKEITRIGGKSPVPVDVRIIASTNKDLELMVEQAKFRRDLLFRLDVVRVQIPSLRERKDDIPVLVKYFIQKLNNIIGSYVLGVEDDAMEAFLSYNWPGNVRELQNCVERALNTTTTGKIRLSDLPFRIRQRWAAEVPGPGSLALTTLDTVTSRAEREYIFRVLEFTGGNKQRAAEILGVSQATLWRKLKEHNIQPPPVNGFSGK